MILDLKRFIAVVEKGNITKAAKELYLTQPALSLSLKRLERELGIPLLSQEGKKIKVTSQGMEVYQIGNRIMSLWESLRQIQTTNMKTPHIVIGVFDNAAIQLAKVFEKHITSKEIQLEIIIESSRVIRRSMGQGMLDISICVVDQEAQVIDGGSLIYSYKENLLPVSNHKFTNALHQIPFILYNNGSTTRKYIDTEFLRLGIKPAIVVESTSPGFMKQLALQGVGVALLPENLVVDEIRKKQLMINTISPECSRMIGVYIRVDRTTVIDNFTNELVEVLRSEHSR